MCQVELMTCSTSGQFYGNVPSFMDPALKFKSSGAGIPVVKQLAKKNICN